MISLLAVDPGVKACGVGYFEDGTLRAAALVVNTKPSKDAFENARRMALDVRTWLARHCTGELSSLVVEGQQVYRIGLQKGDPNDLINLAGVAGALVGAIPALAVKRVMPREWKGQVNADVMTRRIESKLTATDLRRVEPCAPSLRHNIIDAVGIGAWTLGH